MDAKMVFLSDECTYCLSADATQVLVPCKHQCLCAPCAVVLMGTKPFCPLCRAGVAKYVDIGVWAAQEEVATTEPVGIQVMEVYKSKRDDYFARAKPVISYHYNGQLKFEFDAVDGYHPSKAVMTDLFAVLGFKRGVNMSISSYGVSITFDAGGGGMVQRGPGAKYSTQLVGGAKQLSEQEMTDFVRNCAFQGFLSHVPSAEQSGNKISITGW